MRWPPPAKPGEVNYDFFDRFTFVHFGIGVAYGALHFPLAWVVALAVAWELVENPLKAYLPFVFPHASADTWKNSSGDTAAVLSGWACFGLIFSP
jgi:hypothetical protein